MNFQNILKNTNITHLRNMNVHDSEVMIPY